jgi:hypothetical protein
MIKKILIPLTSLFLSLSPPTFSYATPHSLQEKFSQAQAGDYIVTAQDGNYSILSIRMVTAETLLLEEISIPEKLIDPKKTSWKQWVSEKALGNTSWILFEIDRKSGTLVECFSYSKNGWLYLDRSELFLMQLLTLPLSPVAAADRKKIGQPPAADVEDTRALWAPPLVIEGRRMQKPQFDVVKTRWPEDGSPLSLCAIELYFSKELPTFPFPFWMEVHSAHYNVKIRAVDAGHQLLSPMTGPMPHRPPQILGAAQKSPDAWKLFIKSPSYYPKMDLFVIDITGENRAAIPIPFTPVPGAKKEEIILDINTSVLEKVLVNGHHYQWVIIPEGSSDIYVESEEIFPWHP